MFKILIILLVITSISRSEYLSIRKGDKEHRLYSTEINGAEYMYSKDLASKIFPNSEFDAKRNQIVNPAYTLKFQPGSFYVLMQDWEGQKIIQLALPAISNKNKTYLPAKDFLYGLDSLDIYTVSSNPEDSYFTLNSRGNSLLKPLAKYKPSRSKKLEPALVYGSDGKPRLINLNKTGDPFSETFQKSSESLGGFLDELNPDSPSTNSNSLNNGSANRNSITSAETFNKSDSKNSIDGSLPASSSQKPIKYYLPKELIRKELEEVRAGKK